jgi:hypothetical protein
MYHKETHQKDQASGEKMDCCTIANTCMISFVGSLSALILGAVNYYKIKQVKNNEL